MMKAIETQIYGCRFRSRLEARWAVFFSTLGLSWEYEPEGFDLPYSGYYLPDFLVRGFPGRPDEIWVEVKATPPSDDEINKLRELCCVSERHGYFAIGNDTHERYSCCPFKEIIECARLERLPDCPDSGHGCFAPNPHPLRYWQAPHSILDFYPVGEKIPRYGTAAGDGFREWHYKLLLEGNYTLISPVPLESAARAALSARFEHGEAKRYRR